MDRFSVPMALAAFIPMALFAISAVVLQRDLYSKMSKGAFALFAAGMINIAAAGALQTRRWRSACPRGVNWNEA